MQPAPRRSRPPNVVRTAAPDSLSYVTIDATAGTPTALLRLDIPPFAPAERRRVDVPRDDTQTRRKRFRLLRFARYTSSCRSTYQPSLALRVYTFFCC